MFAKEFMDAFPDMEVSLDRLEIRDVGTFFHWTLEGTNTGPGGTGKKVRIRGYELWVRMSEDGLIVESSGNFDTDEYEHQLKDGYKG